MDSLFYINFFFQLKETPLVQLQKLTSESPRHSFHKTLINLLDIIYSQSSLLSKYNLFLKLIKDNLFLFVYHLVL